MAQGAPKGNDFWTLRLDMSEDGKSLSIDKVIKGAKEYTERCIKEKLYEVDFVGKDAQEVLRPKMIVMTIYGLCHHLGISIQTWYNWKKDEANKKYFEVLTRIETSMKAYNIEGAAAGMLKDNLISRLEGLRDNTDMTTGGESFNDLSTMPTDELLKRAEAVKKMNE